MIPYTRGDVLLSIDHVSLSYGDRVILRDVNASIRDIRQEGIQRGQIVCFLGPKGIGKTQLSRVVAGLQKSTAGTVSLLCAASPAYRELTAPGRVGMVPQSYPLFEFATVAQNIEIAGRQGGLTKAKSDEKADAFIKRFKLSQYLRDYPAALSGGTRQSVAIIRQLMCVGNYLILDEPFSGLDPSMKTAASQLVREIADLDERNTVIVVTHDVTEGCAIADTVWLMGREPGQAGARLVEEHDLAQMGICWLEEPLKDAAFLSFVADVKAKFSSLS